MTMNNGDPIITNGPDSADPETLSFTRHQPEWEEHILKLIYRENKDELHAFLKDLFPADIAYLFERLEFEDSLYLFQCLDAKTRGEILLEIDETFRDKIINTILPKDLAEIVAKQESDAATDILADLKFDTLSEVLSYIPFQERSKIAELLSYPENTAGSLMSKEFAAVSEKDTIQKAIQTLRKISKGTEDIYTVYVLDDEGKYRGHLSLKSLILANPHSKVKRIIETELLPIPVDMDREEVANFFDRYNFISLPVVDIRGVMIGRITVDDIIDVIQEEANEDILRMGGVSRDETFNTPILTSSLKRASWLTVNLFTAFIAALVIKSFEATIEKVVILAALMPIVAGMGGNAAGQSMTIIIRNIALGDLTTSNIPKVFRREVILGILNGISMGSLTGIVVYTVTGNIILSMVISSAMLFNLIIASISGTIVPYFLTKLKIDPAIASSILVTTFTDVLGFSIFLGFAYISLPFLV